jgi:hypothetical protein
MRYIADRSGLTTGQVPGPGSVELLIDLLLLHRPATSGHRPGIC